MASFGERESFPLSRQPAISSRARFGGSNLETESAPQVCRVTTVDPFAFGDWDRMVALHDAATAFHTAAWARVLTTTYGHRPFYLHFSQEGKTAALLPLMEVRSAFTGRRAVALPFSDFSPPLFFPGFRQQALLDHLSALATERGWKHFELRGAPSLDGMAPAAETFYGHKLDLGVGPTALRANLAGSVRRNLAKAERSGVTARVSRSREAIAEYYRLHCRTRRRHGAPPQSRKFFSNIHEHLIKQGLGFVVLARRGGRPLAGAVFFTFGKNALYKFGASDERGQEFRASNLAMWEAMRYLAANGSRQLHFGRTAQGNDGLRRFKLGWGALEETMEYYRGDASGDWIAGGADLAGRAAGIFRHLPISVNKLLGKLVYPHLD